MHVGQRSGRTPGATAAASPSASSTDLPSMSRAPPASAGMAGVGAGRSGAPSSSYRPFLPTDSRAQHDYSAKPHWTTSESSHQLDQSALPTMPSTSSFDTQPRSFDTTSMASSSSLHTLPSTISLASSISHRQQPSTPSSSSAPAQATGSTSGHRTITEADLLAFVNEKRLVASMKGKESVPAASTEGSRSHSKDATDANQSLDTLDLCHKRIDRVPDALVDLIKNDIVRLALGYNYISRLPTNFADLHSLRYLNVRANNFAHFPDCVLHMPNLEILDLSRNKIRALPQEPGQLVSLRVLSMNANRLTDLPLWVGRMKHLRILKLDNNPLEWPPPHISKMPNVAPPKAPPSSRNSSAAERDKAKRFEDRQMLVWIAKLRSWINDPANQPERHGQQPSTPTTETIDASTATKSDTLAQSSAKIASAADHFDDSTAAAANGLISLQVQVPESVAEGSKPATEISPAPQPAVTPAAMQTASTGQVAAGLLPPLVPQPSSTGDAAEARTEVSPSQSSPAGLVSTQHDAQQSHSSRAGLNQQVSATPSAGASAPTVRPAATAVDRIATIDAENRQHGRNNSHSVVHDITLTHQLEGRRSLKSKKSLPDLRKSHEDILMERRNVSADRLEQNSREASSRGQQQQGSDRSQMMAVSLSAPASESASSSMLPPARKPLLQTRRVPRPSLGAVGLANGSMAGSYAAAPMGTSLSQGASGSGGGLRKLSLPTVGATQAAADAAAAALAARAGYGNTPPRFDVGHGRMASDRGDWPSRAASPTLNGTRAAADHERNSYFRRLSTLPPATVSKAVPAPVLKFVDGTRGVLFALSQIHAAIGQFMTPVIDERISGQFHRLLDISNGSVANLINALDRFDSLSRRGTPDPAIIRGVLVTCKDSVITFRKLVTVLQLQLRALQSSSDVRYARTLLLMLYGSMAEVSNSWTEMAPLLEAVQPYLTQQADRSDAGELAADAGIAGETTSSEAGGMQERSTAVSTRAGSLGQKSTSIPTGGAGTMLPSIAEASTPVRSGMRPYVARGPSRRRHAGSFSAQDLAQGAAMTPSASNQPPFNLEDLQAASAYSTPARGARSRRQGSWGNSASSAATFAHSDSSDRSAVDGQPAPSTPVPSQRSAHVGTPTSRQKRSGSNASSAREQVAVGTTPRSLVSTPATPATPAEGKRHVAAASLGSGTAATTAAAGRMQAVVAEAKISVDDHLLDMVDNITKLSARVWSILFDHLRSAGVDDKANEHGAGSVEEMAGTPGEGEEEEAAGMQRLRELRDLAGVTDELTSQLRSTYLRAREEEHKRAIPVPAVPAVAANAAGTEAEEGKEAGTETGAEVGADSPENISQATAAKLFDESHQFVRAIVETSTRIKAISVGHEFPRELRRLLGQVAQACSNLTVYLLWLSPAPVA